MIKLTTESRSVYELDEENKRVRRVIGIGGPTPRTGIDGEWKKYEEVYLTARHAIKKGSAAFVSKDCLIIDWTGRGNCTLTSPVVFVSSDDGDLPPKWKAIDNYSVSSEIDVLGDDDYEEET